MRKAMGKPITSEQEPLTPERVRELGARMKAILELNGSPVGVRLLFDESNVPAGAKPVTHHRYCQAVMKARQGDHVTLDKEGLSCPAAASAFGFKPLPAQLRSGKGLVGFGIVADPEVGMTIFDHMPLPFDMEYTRDLGYCAVQFLLDGGTAAMVSIQDGRCTPIPFKQMVDPVSGRAKVRWWTSRRSRNRLRANT